MGMSYGAALQSGSNAILYRHQRSFTPTPPRAKLSREEPDAGNLHVRVCEGWGWQHPHLLGLAVTEVKAEGRRYIVCRNEEEARKDAGTRATLLAGLQRKLAGGAKGLVATPATAASWPRLTAMGSPSTRQRSRPMRSSMAYSSCAPVCRCQPWPWCCATGTC